MWYNIQKLSLLRVLHRGSSLDSTNLLSTTQYSTDSYEAFFDGRKTTCLLRLREERLILVLFHATTDTSRAFYADMESYCNNILKMEEKEASVQNEIMAKTEEMKNLSRILRAKRDGALQAMGQLTSSSFKNGNSQN